MVLTVVSVLLIAHFSYVNLTVGRNFDFKPDLTLILATAQPYITLESVRLLEKNPANAGNRTWVLLFSSQKLYHPAKCFLRLNLYF